MMTELMLVEGVSDVQLISYFLQNVYEWKHEKSNPLGINSMEENEHIEYLSKDGNYLVLCGVGGNGRFAHFVEQHRINEMIVEQDISSIMVVTDRDEATNPKIERLVNRSLKDVTFGAGQWKENTITDSFDQSKKVNTYLLIVPATEEGALERVIINALEDIPEETELIQEVIQFVESLKEGLVPELSKINKANKATVGTFFSVRDPKNAMRSFGTFISKIDWTRSESLTELFMPFRYFGVEKPVGES